MTEAKIATKPPARVKSCAVFSGLLGPIPILTTVSVIAAQKGSSIITFAEVPLSAKKLVEVRDQLTGVITEAIRQAQNGVTDVLESVGGLTGFLPGGKSANDGLGSAIDPFQARSNMGKP